MTINQATNSFENGLVMDFNPLNTPNNVLTSALNATFVTFNGNEFILQNDMGNSRVETAYLPEGYIPLGITELGGVIYVVSYNPLTNMSQIGSFPSPERIFTDGELGDNNTVIQSNHFIDGYDNITSTRAIYKFGDVTLKPGDKYLVYSNLVTAQKTGQKTGPFINLSECYKAIDDNDLPTRRNIKLSICTINNKGELINLTGLKKYESKVDGIEGTYILANSGFEESVDKGSLVDKYRSLVSDSYNTFYSKVAGQLLVVAELEVIPQFNVSYRYLGKDDSYNFRFIIDTNEQQESALEYVNLEVNTHQDIVVGYYTSDNDNDFKEENDWKYTIDYSLPVDTEVPTNVVDFTFTPGMSFGWYRALSQTISIDLSKLGTGLFEINKWRYYKNDNNIDLYWGYNFYPIDNEEITKLTAEYCSVNQTIGQQNIDNLKWSSLPITEQQYYPGNYTMTISFDDNFQENSLYFIKFKFETSREGFEYKDIIKCLYTNGVFNDVFTGDEEVKDENENIQDFDTIRPKLSLFPVFKREEVINNVTTTKHYQDVFSTFSDLNNDMSQGLVTVTDGTVNLSCYAGLENSYNSTFSVDQEKVEMIAKKEQPSASASATKDCSNKEYTFEEQKFQQLGNNTDINSDFDDTQINQYWISNISSNKLELSYNYKTKVYNRLKCDYEANKQITINNYFGPFYSPPTVLETPAGLSLKLVDLGEDGKHFSISANTTDTISLLALGISPGNAGGKNKYMAGIVKLQNTGNTISWDELDTFTDLTDTERSNEQIYELIERIATELENKSCLKQNICGIVPVAYLKMGDGQVRINSYSNENYNPDHYQYGTTDDIIFKDPATTNSGGMHITGTKSKSADRKKRFTASVENVDYIAVQLFIQNDQDPKITETDNFFAINQKNGYLWNSPRLPNAKNMPLKYFGDYLAALLMQLYYKQQNKEVEGNACVGYCIEDTVSTKLILPIEIQLNLPEDEDEDENVEYIKFNNIDINQISLDSLKNDINTGKLKSCLVWKVDSNYSDTRRSETTLLSKDEEILTKLRNIINNTLTTYIEPLQTISGISNILTTEEEIKNMGGDVYGLVKIGDSFQLSRGKSEIYSIVIDGNTAQLVNDSNNLISDEYFTVEHLGQENGSLLSLIAGATNINLPQFNMRFRAQDGGSYEHPVTYRNIKIFKNFNIV